MTIQDVQSLALVLVGTGFHCKLKGLSGRLEGFLDKYFLLVGENVCALL
jgi:hypothetical protein